MSKVTVGFIGLGKMGYPIAANIAKKFNTIVYNRTESVSIDHSLHYGTSNVNCLSALTKDCNVILICLPTFREVNSIINSIIDCLTNNHIIIDCTSSDPIIQKQIHKMLSDRGVHYFDSPVSGGPEKAHNGTLTSMVSGNKEKYNDIYDILCSFSNPIYVGNIGSGCAIKAINNILNVSHLCLAAEGLKALSKFGISKQTALEVINASSGRSLMTQERIPKHIIEKNYNYGFSLGLMKKDVSIALDIIDNPIMFSNILKIIDEGVEKYGNNADYTEIAKLYFESNDN